MNMKQIVCRSQSSPWRAVIARVVAYEDGALGLHQASEFVAGHTYSLKWHEIWLLFLILNSIVIHFSNILASSLPELWLT